MKVGRLPPGTNAIVTTRSTTLKINDRLETGQKLFMSDESSPIFFKSSVTIACFCETGSRPRLNDTLTIRVM